MTNNTLKKYPHNPIVTGHCQWCGADAQRSAHGKPLKYCSKWCTNSMSIYRTTGQVRERKERVEHPNCLECGKHLEMMRGNRNPKKYCGAACSSRHYRKNNLEYVERQSELSKLRAAKREAAKPPKPRCGNCDRELFSRREGIRFCDAVECRSVAYQERKLRAGQCSADDCDRPAQSHGLCGSHASAKWRTGNPDKAYANRARYRARKRDAWVEDIDRSEVLERDNWMCGICGERIPQDAAYPDPKSPSIDHVVPLARGGEHSMGNVQAAHFLCNSTKQHLSDSVFDYLAGGDEDGWSGAGTERPVKEG